MTQSRHPTSPAPGRHRPEAAGLRQATDSPQGLSVSSLSPKPGETPTGSGSPYSASRG